MNNIREKIKENIVSLGQEIKNTHLSELNNPHGSIAEPIQSNLLTYDFSKQRVNQRILDYLLEIPNLINLKESLDSLFVGKIENPSENRASLLYTSDAADDRIRV